VQMAPQTVFIGNAFQIGGDDLAVGIVAPHLQEVDLVEVGLVAQADKAAEAAEACASAVEANAEAMTIAALKAEALSLKAALTAEA
jgi:hypothetical protein